MNNYARAIALSLMALAVEVGMAAAPGNPTCRVRSGNLLAILSPDGRIVGVGIGKETLPITGETIIEGCRTEGSVQRSSTPDGGWEFRRNLVHGLDEQPHQLDPRRCELTERFRPGAGSIRWELEIHGDGAPWSTAIATRLKCPVSPSSRFWTAWVIGNNGDPLEPRPMQAAAWGYGQASWGCGPQVSLPLASVLDAKTDKGVSLVLSPEDTLLDVRLTTTVEGSIAFQRLNHRLGQGRKISFAMDIVIHEADWRGGLRWMAKRYAPFFDPPNPKAPGIAGCGAYSGWDGEINVKRLKRMSFRILWDASFRWPYFGMFLPPVDVWRPNLSERFPEMSYDVMNKRGRQLGQAGFVPLSYFNLSEFGTDIFGKQAATGNLPANEQWKDQVGYLRKKFADSICLDANGREGSIYQGNYIMDPAGASYQAHLREQARRHVEKLPDWAGLVCDRMYWHGGTVNYAADDGVGWYNGRTGRHYTISFKDGMTPIAAIVHRAGKIIMYNPFMAYRLDYYRDVDGFFSEGALDAALLGIRKPVVVWTETPDALKPDPDAFFQRHLHLGAYPMAPYPGNDHSINPDPWAEKYYLDYGPLLDAMRGKKWVLEPHCIEVEDGAAKANLFQALGGYVAPITFGGKAKHVIVRIRNVSGLSADAACQVLHPGSDKWQPLSAARSEGVFQVDVPLQRGCAMLKLLFQP